MTELMAFGAFSFTTFLTIINPLSVMPVFMKMTETLTQKQKRTTANKALLTAFFAMLFFAFCGPFIFNLFGITADSFRIVGGVIFFSMGYDMLQAKLTRIKIAEEEVKSYVEDISITPLAIPMICGPGAITNSILFMQKAETLDMKLILIAAIFSICLITLVVLYGAAQITKFLGDTGNKVLMRIMGLIVMVVAVEFFFSGLTPILKNIIHNP